MQRSRPLRSLAPLALAVLHACGSEPVEVREASVPASLGGTGEALEAAAPKTVDRGDGLRLEIDERGEGPVARLGSSVLLHYEAFLADAETPFDSTYRGGMPLRVQLKRDARPRLIDGLRQGLTGLRAGTRVTMHIPADLAWGEAGNPSIGVGENANLIMKVHLLSVE